MRDDRYWELFETAESLTEYYTEQVGRQIEFGFDGTTELWVKAPRTNGKEYFETYANAEDRVKQLYPDIFIDEDYADPFDGL